MLKKSLALIAVICLCVGVAFMSKFSLFSTGTAEMEAVDNSELKSFHASEATTVEVTTTEVTTTEATTAEVTTTEATPESEPYIIYITVPATDKMPTFYFEMTGRKEKDGYLLDMPRFFYYPSKIVIKADDIVIQEIDFDEYGTAPCVMDDFGFKYGDFRFDGYGGFYILHTSMGKNPSYYFWVWDKDKNQFVRYSDLEMIGYINFDFDNQEVKVSSTGSATLHEFLTYKYINDKLTLIEKIIDADQDGKRRVYKLINGELELIEITESELIG